MCKKRAPYKIHLSKCEFFYLPKVFCFYICQKCFVFISLESVLCDIILYAYHIRTTLATDKALQRKVSKKCRKAFYFVKKLLFDGKGLEPRVVIDIFPPHNGTVTTTCRNAVGICCLYGMDGVFLMRPPILLCAGTKYIGTIGV